MVQGIRMAGRVSTVETGSSGTAARLRLILSQRNATFAITTYLGRY